MAYNQKLVVENTAVILRTVYKGSWTRFQLIVEAGDEYHNTRCMTGPEFRMLFDCGLNAKETAKYVEKYNGIWEHKAHMKIEFEDFDDAKRFVEDIIEPAMLAGRLVANG